MYRGDFFMSSSVDIKRMLRGVLIGAGISAALCAVLMCIAALILNMVSGMPYGVLSYITLGLQGISVLIGSYIAAAITRSRGLITGLIIGALIFILLTILGFCAKNNSVGIMTLLRAVVLLLLGALGGIRGVNKKERVRIK